TVCGLRIVRGVEPRRHRDLGQLLSGGAVVVHVPACRHRVLGDQGAPVRRLPLLWATGAPTEVGDPQPAADVGARRRAVAQQDDIGVPSAMASAAWAAITSQAAPPTAVESIQRGRRPRYSAASIGGRAHRPVDPNPSTSSGRSPGAASAPLLAGPLSSVGEPPAAPGSARATPATATRRLIARPRPARTDVAESS